MICVLLVTLAALVRLKGEQHGCYTRRPTLRDLSRMKPRWTLRFLCLRLEDHPVFFSVPALLPQRPITAFTLFNHRH